MLSLWFVDLANPTHALNSQLKSFFEIISLLLFVAENESVITFRFFSERKFIDTKVCAKELRLSFSSLASKLHNQLLGITNYNNERQNFT